MTKVIRKADIILFVLLLLMGAVLSVPSLLTGGTGNTVRITVDGALYGTYDLSDDREISVGENGRINRIVIKNGKVWMEEASCRNQVCVHTGKISEAGRSIVCLPNRVSVTIEGKGDEGYDAVSGK